MDFGITIKPDISIARILSLTRQAETCGFSFAWIFDSHVIWKEPFPLLTLMATNTDKMRLDTCVTHPAALGGVASWLPWATCQVPLVSVAGSGRKALRSAGRTGDGVIPQFADPHLVDWCLGFVRQGAKGAGREFRKIEVMAAAPVWAS